MKKDKKCEKCKKAEAVVHFSVMNEKNHRSRKQYCKECALSERIRLTPNIVPIQVNDNLSAFELVQKEMENPSKQVPVNKNNNAASLSNNIASLEKSMQIAIDKEDYEKAAKIRDKISEIKKG